VRRLQHNEARPIFRWNGVYAGFLLEQCLFDRYGNLWGRVDDEGKVWRSTGTLLGELVEENYVLSKVGQDPERIDPPPLPARRPDPPEPSASRPPEGPKEGWEDALEELTYPNGYPRLPF
jgi:hypothetical protein